MLIAELVPVARPRNAYSSHKSRSCEHASFPPRHTIFGTFHENKHFQQVSKTHSLQGHVPYLNVY